MKKGEFVFGSGPMAQVVERLRKVAALDTTVLLQGDSGTGKELAARFLHENHPTRCKGPLVSVHCGAMPESLLESELFGHVRGSFTGADRDRMGKFEQAEGGTLFLDEISTMSPDAQIRLLRVLQERLITRVGTTEQRKVDVRVVVATNQELKKLIDAGAFRLDLFYRINTFPIAIPPLCDRPGDIEPLTEHFAAEAASRVGRNRPCDFTSEARQALSTYHWPGNVRELSNAIEYASIECPNGTVRLQDLPPELSGLEMGCGIAPAGLVVTRDGLSLRTAVTNLERELILQSLNLAEGNKARAAELLDLKRTTFLEKLRRLEKDGLLPEDYPARSSAEGSTGFAA